ncbi:MAG: DNA polymerase III subunit epsilon [Alphaproteobacteria bacterium]|nr:DNA polymerase III subunit epsilon [Alphaproteobacteria bacterium]
MREIVLDTETTGLDPSKGDRIVEIGCVELINHVATGGYYHTYINPNMSMPAQAEQVHGLSDDFLKNKPDFREIATEFLEFIRDDILIIHNAPFDLGFLNMELDKSSNVRIDVNRIVDTLTMARKKFPGSPANLDALCRRFEIDLSGRNKHGALLDAQLLAEVYLELLGGRQPGLTLDNIKSGSDPIKNVSIKNIELSTNKHTASKKELLAHEKFLETIKNPLWKRS